jgi:hypothetical protein
VAGAGPQPGQQGRDGRILEWHINGSEYVILFGCIGHESLVRGLMESYGKPAGNLAEAGDC